jgi:hypothetical protein
MKDSILPEAGRTLSAPVIIKVIPAPSSDATLSNLSVNGTTITGFSANIEVYDIELDEATVPIPTVTVTSADPNAFVTITDAASLPGSTTVLVTAEDGVTTKAYTINFLVVAPDDATLSDLSVDGASIPGFSPNTEVYDIELPTITTTVPTVTATGTSSGAGISITETTSLPGSTVILVSAKNGTSTKTYTVNFTVAAPVVSIDNLDVSDPEAKVYPNPANEFLNIEFATRGKRKIDLYNTVGQLIYSVQIHSRNTAIDIKTLNIEGLVTLRIETDISVTNHKVIVR